MANLNTGLTSEQVLEAFYRALHDMTDSEIQEAISTQIEDAMAAAATAAAAAVETAISALDVSSKGGSGKYISAIEEADGKINATATNIATAPSSGGTAAISSGAVYTAIENAVSSAISAAFGAGTTKTATEDNHFNLDDLKTIGRYNYGASIVQNGYVDNLPSDAPTSSGGTIIVENNQLSSRYIQTLYIQNVSNAGTFWKRNYGSSGWSAWYRFDGTQVVPPASLNSINPAQLQVTPPDSDDEMR